MYEKSTTTIILNGETEHFHPEIRNRARMSSSHYSTQHNSGSPSQHNNAKKRNKRHVKETEELT